jgi:hypothetical protein
MSSYPVLETLKNTYNTPIVPEAKCIVTKLLFTGLQPDVGISGD